MSTAVENIQHVAEQMRNLGSPLDFKPKNTEPDEDEKAAFMTHMEKSKAVETLKEELQEIRGALMHVESDYNEAKGCLRRIAEEISDIYFRLNALLTDQFTTDE